MPLEIGRLGNERMSVHLAWLADRAARKVELDMPLVLDPPFQRGPVWTLEQKQAWIESVLVDLPLPAFFINQFGYYAGPHPKYGHADVVIDGQQRIRATMAFMADEFRVRGETWSEQTDAFRRTFRMQAVAQVIYCKFETEHECVDLYLRLLTAGTAHTPEEIAKARALLSTCEADGAALGRPGEVRH